MAQNESPSEGRGRHALTTLRHRDFRLLWQGQLVSTIGDQMQVVAIAWHVYLLTNSALQLGLLGLFRAVPFMTLSLAGGALADALDRKRLLLMTQLTQMLVTSALVAVTVTGTVNVWVLYAVTFLSGAASAFDQPARQALIPNLVPRSELASALTLNTLLRQTSFIVGPGIGGLIIGQFGLGATYLANAISFLAVVLAVLLMGPVAMVASTATNNWDRVLGGLRFARGEPLVMLPLLLDFCTRLVIPTRALLPLFARDVFTVGPQGLGWLTAASSLGAVAGGLALGARRDIRWPIAVMTLAFVSEGVFVMGLGLSPSFYVALVMLFGAGVGNVVAEVLRMTVVQLRTPDHVRGRVTALSGMFSSGGPQLGQLEGGALASFVGPVGTALADGLAVILMVLGFATFTQFRHKMGESQQKLQETAL